MPIRPEDMGQNLRAATLIEGILRDLLKRAQALNPNIAHELFARVELDANGTFFLHYSSADKALRAASLADLLREAQHKQWEARHRAENEAHEVVRKLRLAFEGELEDK